MLGFYKAGRTRGEDKERRTKWRQMTTAGSRFQDETKNNCHGTAATISRETPIGHRRAREEKIRKRGDKATTRAKSGGDKSDGSLCLTAPGPEHLAWGDLSYSKLQPR